MITPIKYIFFVFLAVLAALAVSFVLVKASNRLLNWIRGLSSGRKSLYEMRNR
ncbi:MAG: hypothetical protein HY033_01250 [Ignavibacteriae bacterium]|nr:hypothetical protein [Ignavibacteria bacterium]MBI3363512.1 hypothetical protein [Ignavibacteriota bacterium]